MDLARIINSLSNLMSTHGTDKGIIILLLAVLLYFIRYHMNFNKTITEELKNNREVITDTVNVLYMLYTSNYNYNRDNQEAGDDLAKEAADKIEEIKETYGGEEENNEN